MEQNKKTLEEDILAEHYEKVAEFNEDGEALIDAWERREIKYGSDDWYKLFLYLGKVWL